MDLTQILEKKKELLKQEVEQINRLQQSLNTSQQNALRLDGAVIQIQELIKAEEDKSKEEQGENK